MVFLCDPCWHALAVNAAMRAAGAVSTTALYKEAAGPENDICPFQFLSQRHGVVTWSAAVQTNFLPQHIEISSFSKTQKKIQNNLSAKYLSKF